MRRHERIYSVLLLAYPKQHRDEYGGPMTQLVGDRLRQQGGRLGAALVWVHLIADVVKTAPRERLESSMDTFRNRWWRFAAAGIAVVLAAAGLRTLFEPATGPWYKHVLGSAGLLSAPLMIVAGLIVRSRNKKPGDVMLAVGVLPGAAALVLFWYPPFLLFGLLSLAVITSALLDAQLDGSRHPAAPKPPAG